MQEGNIVKVAFTQADGKIKQRPAALLKQLPPYNDWLSCGISSQLRHKVKGFDIVLNKSHSDYKNSGLKEPSLIRLGFLATIPEKMIEGAIGSISKKTHRQLMTNLVSYLKK